PGSPGGHQRVCEGTFRVDGFAWFLASQDHVPLPSLTSCIVGPVWPARRRLRQPGPVLAAAVSSPLPGRGAIKGSLTGRVPRPVAKRAVPAWAHSDCARGRGTFPVPKGISGIYV